MKKNSLSLILPGLGFMALITLFPILPRAEDEIAALRRQLEEQRALIRQQQAQIDKQMQDLEQMAKLLDQIARGESTAHAAESAPPGLPHADKSNRDEVGDLNRQAVLAGTFPGSFRIPGPGKISLAIGGFVKTVAIADTNAEAMGADFLPANLGTRRADESGAFSIDATLTRLNLDARAPARNGSLRGYIEADLNASNNGVLGPKLRHAYGTWETGAGTLTVGHTWSTFMDLQILPEGLTEPTVSGAIFMRQPQIRWSQPLGSMWVFHAAVEDPDSNDVFSSEPVVGQTSVPDAILGIEVNNPGKAHLRLNGIVRRIGVARASGEDTSATGWGTSLTGRLDLFEKDRLRFCGVYGRGLGRYLLGIQSIDGTALDPEDRRLQLRTNWGALVTYEHPWSDRTRSSIMFGYAAATPFAWQPDGTLKSSRYAAVNTMWQVLPYLTMGLEYSYGRRDNKVGPYLDNHRIMFGVQIF